MQTKMGVKTTEFWSAILGALAMALPAVLSAVSGHPWVAAVLASAGAVLPAIYIWGRSILKAEQARQTDVIPDAWEPTLDRVLDLAETLAHALSLRDRAADDWDDDPDEDAFDLDGDDADTSAEAVPAGLAR